MSQYCELMCKLVDCLTSQLFNLLIFLWWFYRGCSPLPIPNREVKPLMADGTAQTCGRVGSRRNYYKSLRA